MILLLVEGQRVREDIYYVQDGSQILSYLLPAGSLVMIMLVKSYIQLEWAVVNVRSLGS